MPVLLKAILGAEQGLIRRVQALSTFESVVKSSIQTALAVLPLSKEKQLLQNKGN